MLISATGIPDQGSRNGFTLIELMIAVFIISITLLFIAVVPNFDRIANARAEFFAKRLTLIIPIVQQEAILQPAEIGMVFTYEGYGFTKFEDGHWEPILQSRRLKFVKMPRNVRYELIINNQSISPVMDLFDAEPHIIFSSSGELTPFTLYIGIENHSPIFRVDGLENGEVQLIGLGGNE